MSLVSTYGLAGSPNGTGNSSNTFFSDLGNFARGAAAITSDVASSIGEVRAAFNAPVAAQNNQPESRTIAPTYQNTSAQSQSNNNTLIMVGIAAVVLILLFK